MVTQHVSFFSQLNKFLFYLYYRLLCPVILIGLSAESEAQTLRTLSMEVVSSVFFGSVFFSKMRRVGQMISNVPQVLRLSSLASHKSLGILSEDSVLYECHYTVFVMKILMLEYYRM